MKEPGSITKAKKSHFWKCIRKFNAAMRFLVGNAHVGINKDYNLVKVSGWGHYTNWQKIEPVDEKLKELVEAMYNPGSYGYILYTPGGDQVGVMYSRKWGSVWVPEIRLKNGNQLEVTPHKYNSTWAPAA